MRRLWRLCVAVVLLTIVAPASSGADAPRVLRVGTWSGVAGPYASIQSAVDAARPGDWILVGPGDYHESPGHAHGVGITTPQIHLRGMDRNRVVVDGTKPGSRPCDPSPGAQTFGRNGVVVRPPSRGAADGVSIDNLTVCNFLSNANGQQGNEIWFNGGDGTGHQWIGALEGSYLSATSSYSDQTGVPSATYGVFVSNGYGPATISHSYANDMSDAAAYIGACPDCNITLDHFHGEHSATGYSGTNSGGRLVISNSEFDDNIKGIAPNSMNDDDAPSPQDGACPPGASPPAGAHTCAVIRDNYVHDNNDPNVPRTGLPGAGIGIGIVIVGGRNNTIVGNRVTHNGTFGIAVADFPDTETPPPVSHCEGGQPLPGGTCYYEAFGNEVAGNLLDGNGFFGNNGDADLALGAISVTPGNCYHDNTSPSGQPTSTPPAIQTVDGTCGGPSVPDARTGLQLACAGTLEAAGAPPCPGVNIPRATGVTIMPLPAQESMPDPCAGVPANPWCPAPAARAALVRTGGVKARLWQVGLLLLLGGRLLVAGARQKGNR